MSSAKERFEDIRKKHMQNGGAINMNGSSASNAPTTQNASDRFNAIRNEHGVGGFVQNIPGVTVDQNYIQSLFEEYNKSASSAEGDYNNIGYNNASSIYDSYRKRNEDIVSRAETIRKFIDGNKVNMRGEDYKSLVDSIDQVLKNHEDITNMFKQHSDFAGQYETEHHYNAAIEQGKINSMTSAEIREKMDRNNKYRGYYVAPLQEELDAVNEEILAIKNGKTMGANRANYAKLPDLQRKATELEHQIAEYNKSDIAYTAPDGQNVTWQALYDYKKAEEDFNTLYGELSSKGDWQEQSKYITTNPNKYSRQNAALHPEVDWEYEQANTGMTSVTLSGTQVHDDFYSIHMTNEEKEVFNYLYHTQGADAAFKWHDSIVDSLKKREDKYVVKNVTEFADSHPVIASAVSVAGNMVSGVEYLVDLFNYASTGKTDTNQNALASSAIRSTVSEKVDWEIGNWDAFDFVYNTGMSMADSVTSMYTFGAAGGFSLGLSAAAQGTNDALKRGMSNDQAFWNGFFSGVFEGTFESLSIGQFNALKESATYGLKDFAFNIGKSMLVNASEETLTELANIAYDIVINGDFSQYETAIRMKMTYEGMSEAEAKRATALELAQQVAESGASGALMGFVFGGTGSAKSYHNTMKGVENTYGNNAQDLINEGMAMPEGSEARSLAEKYQSRLNDGKNLSGAKLYRQVQANEKALVEGDVSKIQTAVEERLTALGETGDVASIAAAIAKQTAGEKLTRAERKTVESAKYGKRILNELNVENILSGEYSSAWAERLDTDRVNPEAYSRLMNAAEDNVSQTKGVSEQLSGEEIARRIAAVESGGATGLPQNRAETAFNLPKGKSSTEEKIASEPKFEVSENGTTFLLTTNQEVTVKEIASIYNGKLTLRLDNGAKVDAKNISFANPEKAMLYEAVVDMGVDAETANVIVNNYDPNSSTSVSEYIAGVEEAYRYGLYGFSEAEMSMDGFSAMLSPAQKKAAYGLGAIAKKYRTRVQQKAVDHKATKATNRDGKGRVYFDGDRNAVKDIQRESLNALDRLAESLGVNFHIFESEERGGRRVYRNAKGKLVSAPNGYFDAATNTIHIDLYAGQDGKGTILYTAAHELTHFIRQWSPAKFQIFSDFLMEQYGEKGVSIAKLIRRQQAKAKAHGRTISYDTAWEEVVADSCEAMLTDTNVAEKIAMLKAKDKGLFNKIKQFFKDFLAKIKAVYQDCAPDSREGKYVLQMTNAIEQLSTLFAEAAVDAGTNYQNSIGDMVAFDANSQSVAPMLSERTWTESEYVTAREETAKAIAKQLGVTVAEAKKYIDDINSVARLIADDRVRLDYDPNIDSSASVLKPNSDYKWSVDMSTLCAKRLLFTGTFDAIQRRLPNTAFNSEDIVRLRAMMEERGYEVACGICYVESTRREIGTITADFIERYKEAQRTGKPITRINSEGKAVDLKKTQDQMKTTADKASDKFFAEKGYTPTLADLNTTDIDLVKRDHPLVYEAYLNYMNARGQAKPKLLETRSEYKGEILRTFNNKNALKARNNAGGLRLQSFSDFEVAHLIDMMQIVMDMSRVGLKSQAYTKVPAFAEAFGNTGIKINLSLIAKGTGLDAKGNLVFDDVEGIDHKEALRLRDKFSKNVGTILVGKNDAHIIAAMADPRIDYIIPFHKSSWKESLYDSLGLTGYDDYTDTQHEKSLDGSKVSDYDPSEYWDDSKTGDENAQIYLEKCRKEGRIPKFPKFQGYSGYWKLLIDFKMYDNDGVRSPQEVVRPVFDEATNKKILDEYKGGHRTLPVAQDVVDDFIKEYESSVKYSDREKEQNKKAIAIPGTDKTLSQEFVDGVLNSFGIEHLGDYRQVQERTFATLQSEGFFTDVDLRSRIDTNEESGMVIETNKSGIDETFCLENYARTGRFKKVVKLSTLREIPNAIRYGKVVESNAPNEHDNKRGTRFAYITYDTQVDGVDITIKLTIKKSMQKNKFWVHSFDAIRNASGSPADPNNGVKTGATTAGTDDSVPQDPDSVKRSDRDYAPTFYSQMGKVVDAIKPQKMGAGGVVPYLKGKGIKNEEIKWSGIEAWLDGKKSVTKEELQEFVAGSMLQIEEATRQDAEQLDAHIVPVGDKTKRLYINGELVETFQRDFTGLWKPTNVEGHRYKTDADILKFYPPKYYADASKWHKYKLDGGENYREFVFTLPGATYTNESMKTHWGKDARGVLAHARVQDFLVDGKKMLFIEEIQSDWHNAGHKEGYADLPQKTTLAGTELHKEGKQYRLYHKGEALQASISVDSIRSGVTEEQIHEYLVNEQNYLTAQARPKDKAQDAPFRDSYHEFVLKRLIRMAAEEGYDVIGWTPADIQSQRWSETYAEGYRIEYDQDIPKFLRKYGKRWGATVGKTNVDASETSDDDRMLVEMGIVEFLPNYTEVWSMDITDAMKESVLYEGQALYSDREVDGGDSNRSILSRALEGIAQNDIERAKIAEYQKKIADIDQAESQLKAIRAEIKELSFATGSRDTARIKALQEEATRIANRITTYDKQLLRLEASKPLMAVLQREKDAAMKRIAEKDRQAMAQYRAQVAQREASMREHYRDSRKKAVEGREKTAMRHKIKKVVSDLNAMLLHGSKERPVMNGVREAVAAALGAVNMDTIGAEARIAKLKEELMRAKTPEKIQEISRKIDNIQAQDDRLKSRLSQLADAYAAIAISGDPSVEIYKAEAEMIRARIDKVKSDVGDTSLRDMSVTQLEEVYDMYRMVLHTIRNMNKVFRQGKAEDLRESASTVMQQISALAKKAESGYRVRNVLSQKVREFSWNELKPVYAFERLGSKTLMDIFWDVRKGEDTFALDINDAKTFAVATKRKHGYDSWDMNKTIEFKMADGRKFPLTLQHMMAIYAYSKRPQAHDHMFKGGFMFNDKETFKGRTVTETETENGKITKKKRYILEMVKSSEEAYRIDQELLSRVIGTLTDEQRAYVDEMQKYLSDVMGSKGNEVSRIMWGIDLFKESFYFPLKSSHDFLFEANTPAQETALKNSGMSKETVPNASNPIVLSGFDAVWADHVNKMSLYHAFVVPLDTLNKVHNFAAYINQGSSKSVSTVIGDVFGDSANSYIKKFIRDLNGGAKPDDVANPFYKMVSNFKKTAVAASASTIVQQPTAILRAMAYIDPNYFTGKPDTRSHKTKWEEVKKYAPVAILKEIGGFDTSSGRQTAEWLNEKEYKGFGKVKGIFTDSAYRDEAFMYGAALADEIGWITIWEAVKRETHAKTKLDKNSEEFLKKCGERFSEIITYTQVYDSTLSRSGFMRSKSEIMKTATAFMGEPTTSFNMLYNAVLQAKRGGKGTKARAVRTISSVYISTILAAAFASAIYALRDDDDDESYLEKYATQLANKLSGGTGWWGFATSELMPHNMIPFVKDVVSIFSGWEVERMDMTIVQDIKSAWDSLSYDDKSNWRKIEDLGGAIAATRGIPLKNLMRTAREVYNLYRNIADDTSPTNLGDAFLSGVTGNTKSKSEKLYEAIVEGNTERAELIKSQYDDEKAVSDAVRKALRENDPRIKQAAEARYGGDVDEYIRIVKEIKAEKNFVQDDIVAAVNAEISQLKPKTESEISTPPLFTTDDYFNAVVEGDSATISTVRDSLIEEKVEEGATADAAEESVEKTLTNKLKDAYIDGNLQKNEAVSYLKSYGGKDDAEAKSKVEEWDFEIKYGYSWSDREDAYNTGAVGKSQLTTAFMKIEGYDRDKAADKVTVVDFRSKYPKHSDLSESAVLNYYEPIENFGMSLKDTGLSVDSYAKYYEKQKECKGTDYDGDGKTDSGSRKAEVMAVINSLPITYAQKNALYYLNGWSSKTIHEAPWY